MSCPFCSHPKEDSNHFIFVCPAYETRRASLLEGLSDLLSTNMYENKTIHCMAQLIYILIQYCLFSIYLKNIFRRVGDLDKTMLIKRIFLYNFEMLY